MIALTKERETVKCTLCFPSIVFVSHDRNSRRVHFIILRLCDLEIDFEKKQRIKHIRNIIRKNISEI